MAAEGGYGSGMCAVLPHHYHMAQSEELGAAMTHPLADSFPAHAAMAASVMSALSRATPCANSMLFAGQG